jgi:hypothetical protein
MRRQRRREPLRHAARQMRVSSSGPSEGDRDVEKCRNPHDGRPRTHCRRRRRRDRRYGPSGEGRLDLR